MLFSAEDKIIINNKPLRFNSGLTKYLGPEPAERTKSSRVWRAKWGLNRSQKESETETDSIIPGSQNMPILLDLIGWADVTDN